MKSFIFKVFLFIVFIFIADKVFLLIRNKTANKEVDKRLEYVLNGKINSDILIFGASRGARGVLASQINDSLNIITYNLSYPGSNIDFQEFLLHQVINNNKVPKIIILSVVDDNELIINKSLNFRYDRLYPLVKYKAIRKELVERENKNSILSELFVLNTLKLSQFDLRKKNFIALDTILEDGSMPISFKQNKFNEKYKTDIRSYNINDESDYLKNKFISFVDLCYKNKIKLIVVFPPVYFNTNPIFKNRIKELIGKKGYLYTYSKDIVEYSSTNYFYNETHLKKNGAIIFTNEIIDFLQKIMNK